MLINDRSSIERLKEEELRKGVQDFTAQIYDQAEKIIEHSVPKKIQALSALHEKMQRGVVKNEYDMVPQPKADSTDEVSVNKGVHEVLEILKHEICDMVNDLNVLRLWIRLSIPRIEDGNNFGVGVQEEILGMLISGRVSGLTVLQLVSKYYSKRGKIISDMRKRPYIRDYAAAVRDMDEKQYINLVQSCCDLRNNYALLYDKIIKNKKKILKPKGEEQHLFMY